jgi:hypothetical protein
MSDSVSPTNRRSFLKSTGVAAGAMAGLPYVSPNMHTRTPSIEEIAALVGGEPRDKVFAAAADLVKNQGVTYRALLGGILLAGVRDIRPRPVGFKFHAVMMVGAAYQIAQDCAPPQRLLPVFFNLADLKRSQERDRAEDDWVMPAAPDPGDPSDAEARFRRAMDEWDDQGADRAIVALHRGHGLDETFELLWPYAARDFRSIGHKIIYAAQAQHALQQIGWMHAESVLRSLVNALLHRGNADQVASFGRNRELAREIRSGWQAGEPDPKVAPALLRALREEAEAECSGRVVRLLKEGAAPSSLFDGLRLLAFEMLLADPNILTVHPVTALNAFHRAFRISRSDTTRRLLLLQATSWTVMFRDEFRRRGMTVGGQGLDELRPAEALPRVEEVFEVAADDRTEAARMALRLATEDGGEQQLVELGRDLLLRKAREHHDYKFAAAAFEEAAAAGAEVGPRLLAASLAYLRNSGDADGEAYRDALRVL